MLNKLKDETNNTTTENGGVAYDTTKSKVLDFFALGGALRTRNEQDIISIFDKAFCEDEKLALKTLFYMRDVVQGQGERRTFRVVLKYLANKHSDRVKDLIKHIPEYGRWDDLFVLIGTKLETEMFEVIKEQFKKDIDSDTPSLLGKWMKSENTSSKDSKKIAKLTAKALELSLKDYRKALVQLRSKIKIIETKMSSNEWKGIEYDKIPSKAGLIYRKAFFRQDKERYEKYLESVKKGEAKINAGTLYPYEIVEKIMNNGDESETLEALWNNLPNYVKEDENAIVVADTSGSMWGRPIAVSVSLAMYFAERNKGPFANHFITFSERPKLQEIVGSDIFQKVRNLKNAEWDMNTNIQATFDLILDTAIKYNMSQSDMPKKIYIVSDMEFDECADDASKSIFNLMKNKFAKNNYELPEIVFWNVNARNTHVPVTMNDRGVQLVSGCSPIIFKQLMENKSAYDMMIKIVTSDRYEVIE